MVANSDLASRDTSAAGEGKEAGPVDPGTLAPDELRVRTDRPLAEAVAEVERTLIRRALAETGGNAAAAARRLGVSRRGLQLKRTRLGIG